MSISRLLAWSLLAIWFVWLGALQISLAGAFELGPWMPDLGLLALLALAARLPERDLAALALIGALARIALSATPPDAILAGYLAVVGFGFGLRSVVDVRGMGMRAVLAGVAVLCFDAWLLLVDAAHLDPRAQGAELGASGLLPAAGAAAAGAFLLGPLLVHLPGLTPLRKRRW